MVETSSNNRRIAKNTLLLYFRMLLLMIISLFTSRVIFSELGASDFGLYNVVAGFVIMLTFLNGAMGNATQRFLAFELVRNDIIALRTVFGQIQILHIGIAVIIVLLGETLGLWFVNSILNIPSDRLFAANIVYQCSLLSTVFTVISVPYNSMIIAHENMKFFAVISLLEGGLKVVACLLLFLSSSDKLIVYAVCLACISILIRIIYWKYCSRYEEANFQFSLDISKLKEIGTFAVWSLCGSVSTLSNMQGINILINLFFSTVVNAARGIAYQVDSIVRNFVSNFQTAINPQIVKCYSVGDFRKMHSLLFLGSKMSFFILFILSMPIMFNLPYLLKLWLRNYPNDTIIFTQLVLVDSLIVSLSGVLSISAQATGRIKHYQLTMGGILLLNLPIAYFLFKAGMPPYSVLVVSIIIETVLLFLRLLFLHKMIYLNVWHYWVNVLSPILLTAICSIPICYFYHSIYYGEDILHLLISCIIYCIIIALAIFYVGLKSNERGRIIKLVKDKYLVVVHGYGKE